MSGNTQGEFGKNVLFYRGDADMPREIFGTDIEGRPRGKLGVAQR
jgi:hypothetical protein